jgi:hypothetical protein
VPSKDLQYRLTGTDVSASKTLKGVGDTGHSIGAKLGSTFSDLGSKIGGEFGEVLTSVGEGFEKLGGKGTSNIAKLAAGGAALAGTGALLTAMGDKDKAASQQLDQAIQNTGHSAEEFKGQIEETVKQMEKYGDSTVTTKGALMTLTNATHDPKKALDLMGTAADLAAAKHISLDTAAQQLAKGLNGSAKVFTQYGIHIKTNTDGTKDYAGAVALLADTVKGQANAAADTFTGKLKALKTEVTDGAAAFGAKYGPAITSVGVGMMALAPLLGAAKSGFARLGAAATAGAAETVAADETIVAASEEVGAASTLALGPVGIAIGAVVAVGALAAGALHLFGNSAKDAKPPVEALMQAVRDDNETIGEHTRLFVGDKLATDGVVTAARSLGLVMPLVTDAATNNAAAYKTLNAQLDASNAQTVQLVNSGKISGDEADRRYKAVLKVRDAVVSSNTANAQALQATKDSASATALLNTVVMKDTAAHDSFARSLGTTGKNMDAVWASTNKDAASQAANTLQMQLANNAAGILSASLDKLNGKTIGVEEASIAFMNSEDSLTQSVKDNGRSLADNTTKGRANVSAVLTAITAAQQHAQAVATSTGSTRAATVAYRSDIVALRQHLIDLGLNSTEIQKIIDKYARMPKLVMTKIDAQDAATAKLEAFRRKAAAANGQTYTAYLDLVTRINKGLPTGPAGVRLNAGGTDFSPGGLTSIVEREPEIVDLPRGARVTPMSRAPSGGTTQHITVQVVMPTVWGGDEQATARYLAGIFTRTGIKLPSSSIR